MNRIPAIQLTILLTLCAQALPVQSATYYISPTGSDSNPGTAAKPWLTFAYAINSSRAWCGDTLILADGTYGDGTRTGKINLHNAVCTKGNELTITAQNQRQAKIVDSGQNVAVKLDNSAYVIFDGLYATSTDSSGATSSDRGRPFEILRSHHVTLRNNLARNPNRYNNAHLYAVLYSQDVLFEDNEGYIYHRHCTATWQSERVVVRRQYCNARGGMIPGGYNPGGLQLGTAGAVMVFYPCRNCILENSIADGTTHSSYLVGMEATYGGGVLMEGSQVLGSICYRCASSNAINQVSRNAAGTNNSPQNNTIRDVAFIDYRSPSPAIKCQDCMNARLDHITILADPSSPGATGIWSFDSATGGTSATNSTFMTNIVVSGMTGSAFQITGQSTWSGKGIFSHNNGANFSPALPSNWAKISTANPQFGSCKGVWVPEGSPLSGAGTDGNDIGATILYRYVNGVLTSTPLWDPKTGEFPHGAPDLDGTNRVEGQSLFDIHKRLNVNTGGCSFPRNYGDGTSDTSIPSAPVGLRAS